MRLILDRIEKNASGERIAIFENNSELIAISEASMPKGIMDQLFAGVIIEAELVGERLCEVKLLLDETEAKKEEMKSRISNLLKRNKK